MRRKDREVTDFAEIARVVAECDVVRLGFADGGFPYIVPVNFGYKIEGQSIFLFIHGATQGRKAELIRQDGCCSFEMDCSHKIETMPESRSITTRYKCLMGRAKIQILEGQEKVLAMESLVNRYEESRGFDWNRSALEHTMVCRLELFQISCKINRPQEAQA